MFTYGELANNARLKLFSYPTVVKLPKSGKSSKPVISPNTINTLLGTVFFYLNSRSILSNFSNNCGRCNISISNSLQIAGIFLKTLESLLSSVSSVTR